MQHLWPFLTQLGRHELPILLSLLLPAYGRRKSTSVQLQLKALHYCVCSTLEAIIPLDFGRFVKHLPCHHSNVGAATTSMRVGCEPASNWMRPFSFLARTSNAMISSLLGHARYTVLRSFEATSQYG